MEPGTISIEDIKQWLVEGEDKPSNFVDIKWYVIDEEKTDDKLISFRVTHERFPVVLLVLDLEALDPNTKVIRLAIETGINTVDLDKEVKLSLYRFLLDTSKIPYVAIYLFGPEDQIAIAADLDKRALTKEELDSHLASLFVAYSALTEIPQIREQLQIEAIMVLLQLVASWIREGLSRDDMISRLVAGGLDRELGEALVDRVIGTIESNKKNAEDMFM